MGEGAHEESSEEVLLVLVLVLMAVGGSGGQHGTIASTPFFPTMEPEEEGVDGTSLIALGVTHFGDADGENNNGIIAGGAVRQVAPVRLLSSDPLCLRQCC